MKLESLHHQKQTQGLKVDTLGGSEYVVCVSWAVGCHQNKSQSESSHMSGFKKKSRPEEVKLFHKTSKKNPMTSEVEVSREKKLYAHLLSEWLPDKKRALSTVG